VLHVLLPLLRCDCGCRGTAGLTAWADLHTPRAQVLTLLLLLAQPLLSSLLRTCRTSAHPAG
jgi:hypothetical protein